MGGDTLGVLQRAAAFEISRYPRRAERVAAGGGRKIRGARPALDHSQHVSAVHAVGSQGTTAI